MLPKKYAVLGLALAVMMEVPFAQARTFDFKFLGTQGSSDGGQNSWYSTKVKRAFYQIKVGSAGKTDDMAEMEIRAATVLKNIKDRKVAVNDIAFFRFEPKNVGKAIFFEVATGVASSRIDREKWAYDSSYGWQVAGCLIEILQRGKVVKRWCGAKGVPASLRLDDSVKQMRLDDKGNMTSDYQDFENATKVYCTTSDRKPVELDEVMEQFASVSVPGRDEPEVPAANAGDDVRKESDSSGEFTISKFCGYEFGSSRPELASKGLIRMQKPFRHYDLVRLTYGAISKRLTTVRLESRKRFLDQEERLAAAAGAAAVFEKKYGIVMENNGSSYYYGNRRISICISCNNIEVRNVDEEERNRQQEMDTKRKIMKTDSNEGADVL